MRVFSGGYGLLPAHVQAHCFNNEMRVLSLREKPGIYVRSETHLLWPMYPGVNLQQLTGEDRCKVPKAIWQDKAFPTDVL